MAHENWSKFSDIYPPIEELLYVRYLDGSVVVAHLHHVMRVDGWVLPILYDQSGNTLMILKFEAQDLPAPVEWRFVSERSW